MINKDQMKHFFSSIQLTDEEEFVIRRSLRGCFGIVVSVGYFRELEEMNSELSTSDPKDERSFD
jgi:hypothetical protein